MKSDAIVSLTFDDGLDSHLDQAMPMLEAVGLRGTFFVNLCSPCLGRRAVEWRRSAENGHELGNHTLFHPGVPSKPWVRDGNDISRYSRDRMRLELEVANNILEGYDGRTERTFAYPCGNPLLGVGGLPRRVLTRLGLERTRLMGWVDRHGGDWGRESLSYKPIVRGLFVAARGGGGMPACGVVPTDRYAVPGFAGDGCDGPALCAAVDRLAASGGWGVFVFHGIGGGHHLSCRADAFQALMQRLAGDSGVRVLTFIEAARVFWPSASPVGKGEGDDA